jgi:hypothetical protein
MPALEFDKKGSESSSPVAVDDGAEWKNCFQRSYSAALVSVGKAARRFSTGSGIETSQPDIDASFALTVK